MAYTGIIDCGEIGGTDRFYGMDHVALHDVEQLPEPLLPHLLAGYDEVFPLPPDHEERVLLWRLLIGIRALARGIGGTNATAAQRHLTGAIRRAVVALP